MEGELKRPFMGLLLGGPVRNWEMTETLVENLVQEMLAFVQEKDGEFIAATSRRTPPEVEAILGEKIKKRPPLPRVLSRGRD